jgi:transposase
VTGRDDDTTPYGPDEPPEPPQAALVGEIMPYSAPQGDAPQDGYTDPQGRWRKRNQRYGRDGEPLDEDFVEQVVRARLQGMPLREVAARFGVSHETVRKWSGQATDSMVRKSAEVARVRAKLVLELQAVRHEAWKMARESGHPTVTKDMLTRVESAIRAEADLLGAKAPFRAEVQVTELSQEDLKAQEMIREAQAKAAADRSRVEAEFRGEG